MHHHIRKIFSLFALGMMAVFGVYLSADAWSLINWGMLAISGLVCLLVFRCFVYIFNYSYSLACLLNGSLLAITGQSMAGWLLGAAMMAYGARLLWFTQTRYSSESYADRAANVQREDAKLPFPVKVALWVQCSFLYTFHLFGVYLAAQQSVLSTGVIAGFVLIVVGLVIEALADAQKQSAKAVSRDSFVSSGLFARWRHPNYVGEIIVQVGLLVAGLSAVGSTWSPIAAVTLAPFYIILLMLSECLRADESMELRYGDQEAFREYRINSGSFLPKI